MENNPFEADTSKKRRKIKKSKSNTNHSPIKLDKHTQMTNLSTTAKTVVEILELIEENRWLVIILSSVILGEYAAPIIIIAIFSGSIKNAIIRNHKK